MAGQEQRRDVPRDDEGDTPVPLPSRPVQCQGRGGGRAARRDRRGPRDQRRDPSCGGSCRRAASDARRRRPAVCPRPTPRRHVVVRRLPRRRRDPSCCPVAAPCRGARRRPGRARGAARDDGRRADLRRAASSWRATGGRPWASMIATRADARRSSPRTSTPPSPSPAPRASPSSSSACSSSSSSTTRRSRALLLSLDGKANRLATMVRGSLPLAMQGLAVVPLFAGYDLARGEGRIFSYDVTGGRYEEREHHAVGSGAVFARGSLKKRWRPGLSAERGRRRGGARLSWTPPTTTRPRAVRTSPGGSGRSSPRSPRPATSPCPTRRSPRWSACCPRAAPREGWPEMTFPFYVSPEQLMKDRADYARKGIARGRSVVVVGYDDGIAFATENPSRALHKIGEIYDRIAFAAVGKYNEFENLRVAGVRYADLRGLLLRPRPTSAPGRWPTRTRRPSAPSFTTESKPLEVELVGRRGGRHARAATRSTGCQLRRLRHRRARLRRDGWPGRAAGRARGGGVATRTDLGRRARAWPSGRSGSTGADAGATARWRRPARGGRPRPDPAAAGVPAAHGRRWSRRPRWRPGAEHGPADLRPGDGVRRDLRRRRRVGGCRPTRSRGTCSARWSPGVARRTCSCATGPGCTSTSARTRSTRPPSATTSASSSSHDRGGRAGPRGARRRRPAAARARGDPGADPPVQEQHRLGGQLLRLPRELPDPAAGRLLLGVADVLVPFLITRQMLTGAGKVLATPAAPLYSLSQRADHIWESVSSARPRGRAPSSTPGTSRTRTRSSTGACT